MCKLIGVVSTHYLKASQPKQHLLCPAAPAVCVSATMQPSVPAKSAKAAAVAPKPAKWLAGKLIPTSPTKALTQVGPSISGSTSDEAPTHVGPQPAEASSSTLPQPMTPPDADMLVQPSTPPPQAPAQAGPALPPTDAPDASMTHSPDTTDVGKTSPPNSQSRKDTDASWPLRGEGAAQTHTCKASPPQGGTLRHRRKVARAYSAQRLYA